MLEKREPPDWLLKQLFINIGVFNNDGTSIISGLVKPDLEKHEPGLFEIDLASRADWEAMPVIAQARESECHQPEGAKFHAWFRSHQNTGPKAAPALSAATYK